MSVSHCIGMCGAIVVLGGKKTILLHILYNLGRITTYCALGAISSTLGYQLSNVPTLHSWLLILLGAILLIIILMHFFKGKSSLFLQPNIFNIPIIHNLLLKSIRSKNPASSYLVGLINGLFPCAIVYYFLLLATTKPSLIQGILVMICFGVATLIPMLLLAIFSYRFSNFKIFFTLGLLGVAILASLNIYRGIYDLAHPNTKHHHSHPSMYNIFQFP